MWEGGSALHQLCVQREILEVLSSAQSRWSGGHISLEYRIALIFRGSKFLRIAALKEFVE